MAIGGYVRLRFFDQATEHSATEYAESCPAVAFHVIDIGQEWGTHRFHAVSGPLGVKPPRWQGTFQL